MMIYEKPIMNISVFRTESISTTDPPVSTNLQMATYEATQGLNQIQTNTQKALTIIQFSTGTPEQ